MAKFNKVNKILVLYPGRFQPFGKHHAATFLGLRQQFPGADIFIVTSDVTSEKSPFNFNEKKAIISAYGLASKVKKVKNPYQALEVVSKYDPNTTALIFAVGKKDAERLSHGTYFKSYPGDVESLDPLSKNGYVYIAPHISLNVPGYGEMSGSEIRKALGDPNKTKAQKKKLFNDIFGWYSDKLADIILNKLTMKEDKLPGGSGDNANPESFDFKELEMGIKHEMEHTKDMDIAKEIAMDHLSEDPRYYSRLKKAGIDEHKLFSPAWWKDNLNEEVVSEDIIQTLKSKFSKEKLLAVFNDLKKKVSIEGRETKEAFQLLVTGIQGEPLTDSDKKKIADQLKDLLKAVGLGAIAVLPGGAIVMGLLKLFKIQNLVLPSAFINEEPCWKGYKQIGMKKKRGHTVPNCVPIKESLNEGGAAGHMAHPFDLANVNTGKDLVKIFVDSVKSLQENPAAVKIDGINTTLKVVKKNGKIQFALDRGSMNPIDVAGITVTDLSSRFAAGHGMLTIGKNVLDAFNACLPKITSELKALGMLDDPTILLNVETVIGDTSGKANVIAYKENFFVIHGLLKSEPVTPKRRAQKEISGSSSKIQALVDKCKPIMKKLGYGIYGMIPTQVKGKITFTEPLNTTMTVKYNDKKKVTKTIKDWLATAKNPKNTKIRFADGRVDTAMTKKNYLSILDQTSDLDSMTTDTKAQKMLIDGAVMYHATRLMGNAVIKGLGSEVGDVAEHEGIVIRDPKISSTPFKITGEFIVSGLASGFGK